MKSDRKKAGRENMNITVESDADRIRRLLLERLAGGLLKPGDKLLPEAKLAAADGVSLRAVRTALNGLARDGLLERRRGRGTIIKSTRVAHPGGPARDVALLCFDFIEATTNAYLNQLLRGVGDRARRESCELHLHPVHDEPGRHRPSAMLRELLHGNHYQGVLLLSWIDREAAQALMRHGIPVVAAGFAYRDVALPAVLRDTARAVELALGCARLAGHRRIGLITGSTGADEAGVETEHEIVAREYDRLLAGTEYHQPNLLRHGRYTRADGERLSAELLREASAPTALVVTGTEMTRGVLDAVGRLAAGASRPTVIGLVAEADDLPRPCVREPVDELGTLAMRRLLTLIETGSLDTSRLLVKPDLLFF